MLPSLNLLLAYFRKTAFPFSNTGRVQSSGGSEQQQLSVNGSFVSVWRCLLEASYSPAPGSARSPVFSLNVNIRPHLAPGVTPPTSKIRLRIFLSDQLYEVRAGSGDPERSASTILFTSTRTQVQKILVSDGDSWFFVIVKTRPQRICITMHQLPCTPGSGTTGIITQPLCFQLCRQLNTNQGWSLSLLITSSSFFVYHQISGRGCWNNDTSFS